MLELECNKLKLDWNLFAEEEIDSLKIKSPVSQNSDDSDDDDDDDNSTDVEGQESRLASCFQLK